MRAIVRVAAVALLSAAWMAPAHAFERATVQSDPSTPLYWRHRTIHLRPAYATSGDLSPAAAQSVLARSIATWNAAADGCSDLRFVEDRPPDGTATNLQGGEADGENRVVWREDAWPDDQPLALAITTWIYRPSTGEIIDADIDVNGVTRTWTDTTDSALIVDDLENTLTHELGHVLGLGHTGLESATMYMHTAEGDLEKRTLADDDIAGLCHVYPEGLLTPGAPLPPVMPLRGACAASPGAPTGGLAWMSIALVALIAGARGSRRCA